MAVELTPLYEQMKNAIVATFKQGKKAVKEDGTCVYRTDDPDCKCVIGHMMTDEEMEEHGDRSATVLILINTGWRQNELTDTQKHHLTMLQACHDNISRYLRHFVEEFESNLMRLAGDTPSTEFERAILQGIAQAKSEGYIR